MFWNLVNRLNIAPILPDFLAIIGTLLVSYGTWLIYEPAGFIVGGLFLLISGIIVVLNRNRNE